MLDELPPLAHVDAETVDEAVHWLAEYGARAQVLAGGTDLLGLMKDGIDGPRMPRPDVLVNIKTIPALGAIETRPDGSLGVGATVLLVDLESHPVVRERFPALAQAATSVATAQIRAMGTVGGNLCQRPWCWYFRHPQFECFKRGGRQCFAIPGNNRTYFSILGLGICVMSHPSDLAPALMALGAAVEIAGPAGTRRVPIDEFFRGPRDVSETVLGPAEIVTRVDVPPPAPGSRSAFLKHRVRGSWDFALGEVAVSVAPEGGALRAVSDSSARLASGCASQSNVRIALGGVAPFPFRARAAEDELRGRPLTPETIARAVDAAVAKARPLPMNGYKVDLMRALVRRALTAVAP